MDSLTVRGLHVHLKAIHTVYASMLRGAKDKAGKDKCRNHGILDQINKTWSQSLENDRAFPVVKLNTTGYLEVMQATSSSRWPEFSCVVCVVLMCYLKFHLCSQD